MRHAGAFAEFLTLPEANLHEVPQCVPTHQAVFAEPLAAACEILDQVPIPRGGEVAVLGDGKLGLLIAQVLHVNGSKVHQFGRHKEKLQISARAGIQTEILRTRLPVAEYDWTVDATEFRQRSTSKRYRMTRPRGTVVMKSTVHRPVPVDTRAYHRKMK